MSAVNGRRWASPFPPTNSADQRRYDDVILAAPKPTGGSRLDHNWLLLKEEKELNAEKSANDVARLRFDDGAGESDADSDFEVDTGGGQVLFTLAPRGPWPGHGGQQQQQQQTPRPATSFNGHAANDSYYMHRRQQPAVLHRAMRTHPLIASTPSSESPPGEQPLPQLPLSWHHPLPTASTTMSAPAGPAAGSSIGGGCGSKSSKGFSLRRLLHIKPSSSHSVSRSRSSASAASAAMTATPQSRSRAPSGGGAVNGKSLRTFAYTDSKIYQPHQQSQQQQQHGASNYGSNLAKLNGVNGGGSATTERAAKGRNSRYSTEISMQGSSRLHPTPDYWGV